MAALYSELSGNRIVDGRVVVPSWGPWHADVTIDREVSLAATGLTLIVGNLVALCSVWRTSIPYQGRTRVRLVGGANGWGRSIADKGYALSGGVKLSLVLGDLARATGETVAVGEDRRLGTHYLREAGPANRHLNTLVPGAWWVDFAGVTRTGVRASTGITSSFAMTSFDGARRVAVVASESPVDFVPGRTMRGFTLGATLTLAGVTHVLSRGALRTEVLAA